MSEWEGEWVGEWVKEETGQKYTYCSSVVAAVLCLETINSSVDSEDQMVFVRC